MTGIHGDEFIERAEQIGSRSDFCTFTRELLENFRQHPDEWENASLEDFLRALAGFAENMDGYYSNIGATIDCDVPNWRIFADMLLAARVYE